MKKMLLFGLLIFLNFSANANASSQSHRYQIEIILFQHRNTTNLTQEDWPDYPPLPETSNAIDLQPADENSALADYQLLPPRYWTLGDEARRIRNSSRYKFLGHLAWQQTVPVARFSQPAHLHLENHMDNGDYWKLDGTLALLKSNYIIVNANLLLSVPRFVVVNPNSPQQDLSIPDADEIDFTLKQQRKMRPRELYYFDQPLFGMLIKVSPVS